MDFSDLRITWRQAFGVFSLWAMTTAPGQAAWFEASSEHFVVYAKDKERDLREVAEQLERYNSAMALVTQSKQAAPSPSNRVTIFVVGSTHEVRKLFGDGTGAKYIGGFFIPRAGSSIAIVPRADAKHGRADWQTITVLHEYAHYFLTTNNSFPLPRWLSEGAAEFFASASFGRDGGIDLGLPAGHRAGELFYGTDVSAGQLLDPDTYPNAGRTGLDAFYGKSWLLYHYLTFDKPRQGQLLAYVRGLMAGKRSRDAALEAFGDFEKLDDDLRDYLKTRRMLAFRIKPEMLRIGPVTTRRLSDGEAAIMPVRIRSKVGVDAELAAKVVIDARKVATKYPDDAAVLSALAEAEYDAGNDQAALEAANAALAIDPHQVNAYIQKGFALFRLARQAPDPAKSFAEARQPFLALNRIEPDHPLPLVNFYRSFVEMDQTPTANAIDGLEAAAQIAPFDLALRMMAAQAQINEGRFEAARHSLKPVAYNPHGGELADQAQSLLDSIAGKTEALVLPVAE